MKLLFDCSLDETPFFIKLMEHLKDEYKLETAAVTLGKRRVKELSDNNILTYNLSDYVTKNLPAIKERIKELKRYDPYKAGKFSLAAAAKAERYIDTLDHNRYEELSVGAVAFFEELFDEYDYLVGPGMAFTLHYTAYLASLKKYGRSKYLAVLTTRNPNGRVAFCDNHIDSWGSVKLRYDDLMAGELDEAQERLAENFIDEFRTKHTRPDYMNLKYQSPKIRGDQIKEVFKRYYGYYVAGWKNDPYDYYNQNPFFYIKKYLTRFLKGYFDRSFFKGRLIDPKKERGYLYFPLHFQPEATTLLLAPDYVDQINFLQNLSKVLPAGYTLIVKEHPSSVGYRPRGYYKAIEKIPDVRLVSHLVDSQELAMHSDAIVVLSGTAGWEALLHKVPVVAFGEAFYNDSGLAIKCESYGDFPAIMDRIKKKELGNEDGYDDMIKKFVVALHERTYEGYFTVPKFDQRVMTTENVQSIASAILKEIGLMRAGNNK